MEPTVRTYRIKVVREPGENVLTGQFLEYEEQSFDIDATSIRAAYSLSHLVCTLRFSGQIKRTFVDGHEYFNERY